MKRAVTPLEFFSSTISILVPSDRAPKGRRVAVTLAAADAVLWVSLVLLLQALRPSEAPTNRAPNAVASANLFVIDMIPPSCVTGDARVWRRAFPYLYRAGLGRHVLSCCPS